MQYFRLKKCISRKTYSPNFKIATLLGFTPLDGFHLWVKLIKLPSGKRVAHHQASSFISRLYIFALISYKLTGKISSWSYERDFWTEFSCLCPVWLFETDHIFTERYNKNFRSTMELLWRWPFIAWANYRVWRKKSVLYRIIIRIVEKESIFLFFSAFFSIWILSSQHSHSPPKEKNIRYLDATKGHKRLNLLLQLFVAFT